MGAGLQIQTLDLNDFSGGMTENFIKGSPNRYQLAENFLLTVDHKLQERNGSVIYDSTYYQIPSAGRVGGLLSVINETLLLAASSRNVYDTADMSSVSGPTGNPALGEGDIYAGFSSAEWNRQILLTNDQSVSSYPSLLFRASNNLWKAVTAGLPRVYSPPNYANASLLNSSITLANAILTSMISHMNDSDAAHASPTFNLHTYVDKYSLSYIQTQSWSVGDQQYPGPSPTPTAAPAATDQASLFTLVGALCSAYKNHVTDEFGQIAPRIILYHGNNTRASFGTSMGPNAPLSNYSTPTSLATAAAQLDDLYTKWKWHQLAVNVHSYLNDYTALSRYLVTAPKIGTINLSSAAPTVTANFTDLYNFANNLARIYNAHVGSGGSLQAYEPVVFPTITTAHSQPDVQGTDTLAFSYKYTLPSNFATDYETLGLVIYWVRALYALHQNDSQFAPSLAVNSIKFNTTAGSTSLTSVQDTGTSSSQTLAVGSFIYAGAGTFTAATGFQQMAKVTASGSGTATIDRTAVATASAVTGQSMTGSYWHPALVPGSQYQSGANELLASGNDSIGTDFSSWLTLGKELFNTFVLHRANANTHAFVATNALLALDYASLNFFFPEIATYTYAFVYSYFYTVETNGIQYQMLGNPTITASLITCPTYPLLYVIPTQNSTYYNSITVSQNIFNNQGPSIALPTLSNNGSTNYDTSVLTLQIYRTVSGGTVYYKLADLANGTSTYHDQTNDTLSNPGGSNALNTNAQLYTTGGTVAYDQAPISRCLHILNNVALYGYITDTGQVFPNRLRQSPSNTPYVSPATFTDDLEDEIVAISSVKSNFIVLCKNSVYRIVSLFTPTGQGSLLHERISDTIGCVSMRSVVRTEIGVFFAANDGFYYTDGYQLIKISIEINKSYQAFTKTDKQRKRINGAYDKLNRRIWWNVQESQNDSECNRTYIFYVDYGVKPSGVFTTASNLENWNPSAMVFFNKLLVRGESTGYLFKEDPNSKTDPNIDITVSPSSWTTAYIPFDWRSCSMDFGTDRTRKWVPKVHLVGSNVGNQSVQLNCINDNQQQVPQENTSSLRGLFNYAAINYMANPIWGDAKAVWGDASYLWKYDGKMDVWRRTPAGGLRSNYRQFQITNLRGAVYRYEDYPTFAFSNVDSTAKTATIVTPSGYTAVTWPLDVVGMYISFDADSYVKEYKITALTVSNTKITFTDASNTSVTNTKAQWVIRGYKNSQRVSITSLTIYYALLSEKFGAYQKTDSGENV